jgi:hypothetical protein
MKALLFLLGAAWAVVLLLLLATLIAWVFLTTKSLSNAFQVGPVTDTESPGFPLSPGQSKLRRIIDRARIGLAAYVGFILIPLELYTFF